jgi:hypothetical protein
LALRLRFRLAIARGQRPLTHRVFERGTVAFVLLAAAFITLSAAFIPFSFPSVGGRLSSAALERRLFDVARTQPESSRCKCTAANNQLQGVPE